MLGRAARAMRETKGRRFLVINSSPSFAATWLVARIGKFKALHPDIDVLLDANPKEDTLDRADVDAMIRWGDGDFPGLATTLLFKEDVFPVCAPALATARADPHPAGSRAITRCCISNGIRASRPGPPGPTG